MPSSKKECTHCQRALLLKCFYVRIRNGGKPRLRMPCKECHGKIMKDNHIKRRYKTNKKCKSCGGIVKYKRSTFCSGSCAQTDRFKNPKNHPFWRGEDGNTCAIHKWINKAKGGRPLVCEWCGKDPGRGKDGRSKIHWANLSGDYKRELNDWAALCITCHTNYDKPWLKRERDWHGRLI